MTLLVGGELLLYGDVGGPFGWGDGFSPRDVVMALVEHGPGDITVRLNSAGGIASDGKAIHSILLAHAGKVTIIVDGIAASAASLILMAGDERIMRAGSMLMIHDLRANAFNMTAADAEKAAAVLDAMSEQYAGIYAATTGLSVDAARALMKAETWFTAEQALADKFITAIDAVAAQTAAAFDYRVYAHAPANLPVRANPRAGSAHTIKEPSMKAWVDQFFAAAEKTSLPLASLNAIVAKSDTLEVAQAALIEAQAASAAADPAVTQPVIEPAEPDLKVHAWAGSFFASAERSGLPLADLNGIVAKSDSLATAQAALIDAMAARAAVNKPATTATSPLANGDKTTGYDAGRAKVLAIKGKAA
jgi:ATP-dependent protease ClpP protease subunit